MGGTVRWRGTHTFDKIVVNDLNYAYQRRPEHVYYVDPTDGLDTNSGSSWTKAKKTFAAALALATDWDAIICGGGDYTEDGLEITQRGLKILGVGSTGLTRGPVLFLNTTDHIFILRDHDIEIAGIGFYNMVAAKACIAAAELPEHIWRAHIHHNGFSGDGTGAYGIYSGAVAAEAPYMIVEDNRFYNIVTTAVRLNSSAMIVRRNHFSLPNNAIGIEVVPTSSSRPDKAILDNKMVALGSGSVGVKVTNTPASGELMIDGNHFSDSFASAAACIDVTGATGKTGLMGLNYHGITAIPLAT